MVEEHNARQNAQQDAIAQIICGYRCRHRHRFAYTCGAGAGRRGRTGKQIAVKEQEGASGGKGGE